MYLLFKTERGLALTTNKEKSLKSGKSAYKSITMAKIIDDEKQGIIEKIREESEGVNLRLGSTLKFQVLSKGKRGFHVRQLEAP